MSTYKLSVAKSVHFKDTLRERERKAMNLNVEIPDDLAERLAQIARETEQPFKAVVNDTLRRGLAERAPSMPPFDYQGHPGNLLPGIDPRRLNELAWQGDEDRFSE